MLNSILTVVRTWDNELGIFCTVRTYTVSFRELPKVAFIYVFLLVGSVKMSLVYKRWQISWYLAASNYAAIKLFFSCKVQWNFYSCGLQWTTLVNLFHGIGRRRAVGNIFCLVAMSEASANTFASWLLVQSENFCRLNFLCVLKCE